MTRRPRSPMRAAVAAWTLAKLVAVAAMVTLVVQGCATPEPEPGDAPAAGPATLAEALALLDDRPDWASHPPVGFPRHPAEKFLAGWVIVLDPGHGGDAHREGYKVGPTGVREAEMNWRVGVLLDRLLTDAGAHVTLTRHGDEREVGLAERARVANAVARPGGGRGADLFISLHHNAASRPEANYTSVWFHGPARWSEPDLDLARYAAHHLGAGLRTTVGYTSPLMSDQQMYGTGFGVLRMTKVPAILTESSFFTHPEEEQRLRDAVYNLREAYAIYLALCEYAYGGRPSQTTPEVTADGSRLRITTTLDDGMPKGWWGHDRDRTIASTVVLALGDRRLDAQYDPATKTVTAEAALTREQLAGEGPVTLELWVHHANFFKHHNFPQRYAVELAAPGGKVAVKEVTALGARRVEDEPFEAVLDWPAGAQPPGDAADPPAPEDADSVDTLSRAD